MTSADVCEGALDSTHSIFEVLDPSVNSRGWLDRGIVHLAMVLQTVRFLVEQFSGVSKILINDALEASLDHLHHLVVMDSRLISTPEPNKNELGDLFKYVPHDKTTPGEFFSSVVTSRTDLVRGRVVRELQESVEKSLAHAVATSNAAVHHHSGGDEGEANSPSGADATLRDHGSISTRPISAGVVNRPASTGGFRGRWLAARDEATHGVLHMLQDMSIPRNRRPFSSALRAPATKREVVAILKKAAEAECDAMRLLRREAQYVTSEVDGAVKQIHEMTREWDKLPGQAGTTSPPAVMSQDNDGPQRYTTPSVRRQQRSETNSAVSAPYVLTKPRHRLDGSDIVAPSPKELEALALRRPGSHYPTRTCGANLADYVTRTRALNSHRLALQIAEKQRTEKIPRASQSSNFSREFQMRLRKVIP